MAAKIEIGLVHDCHPIYGIGRSNVADRLTPKNWRKKAIVRKADGVSYYAYVQRVELSDTPRREATRYRVFVHRQPSEKGQDYEADFMSLEEALAYANGQSGRFGAETQPDPYGATLRPSVPGWTMMTGRNLNPNVRGTSSTQLSEEEK